MTNERIRSVLERRTRLEIRILELGGKVPNPWPWDYDTSARNLQLIETIEALEKQQREGMNQ